MLSITISFYTAFHISYTVNVATETAVRASISTPAGPVCRAVAVIFTAS